MLTQKTEPLVSVRTAVESDKPFIFKSWINSYYDMSRSRHLPRSIFFPGHWKVIDKIFKHATTLVLNSKDHDDHIIGFATFRRLDDRLVMDYVYVKSAFRDMGFAKHLFDTAYSMVHAEEGAPWFYTHRTEPIARFADRCRAIYNPYLAHEVIGEDQESESHAGPAGWNVRGRDLL